MTVDRRAAFLAQEADARLTWDLAVAAVPPSSVAECALPEGRSVKDLVAHMAAWEHWATERIRMRREGRAPAPIPDWEAFEHAFNEKAYARWKAEPWDRVQTEAATAYAEFRAMVEALSDEELLGEGGSARMIAATGSRHYEPYIAQIRSFVETLPLRTQFETERLRLRSFRPSDAPFLVRMFGDPEVRRFIPPGPPITLERAQRSADRRMGDEHRHGFGRWIVERKDTGEAIGNCGFSLVENTGPGVELAYHYVPSTWGQGFGTEAAVACLARGFEALGFEQVIALCYPENTGSWRVMEKAGMRSDGTGTYYGLDLKRYLAERGWWRAPRA